MGKYMENESLDVMVSAIVDKALEEYKQKLIDSVEKHYNDNLMCAEVSGVKVATKNQIMKIITETEMNWLIHGLIDWRNGYVRRKIR